MEITDFEFVWQPLAILKYPNPVLKTRTKTVTNYDHQLRETVYRLLASMYLEPGCGLSANQVGLDQSIFVTDVDYRREVDDQGKAHYFNMKPRVFINPRFISKNGKQMCNEGCLSFPGLVVQVERAKDVVIEFENLLGEKRELEASDFFADCLQHEADHLDGVTFLDRLSRLKRDMATKKYTKLQRS